LTGAGICPEKTYGETDDFSYNIAGQPVYGHDLQAAVLHLLGRDYKRLILSIDLGRVPSALATF